MSEDIKSKALNLAELVDYQNGSVVSRTLIDKKVGTITVFAFDKGQSISTHSTPFDAPLQVVEGKAKITIADKILELTAGQMVIMPADIPHAVEAIEKFKMMLVMIRQ